MQRVLIVRTDRLGDVIQTLPMAHLLKTWRPDLHIAMLVSRYTAPLLELAPYVDEVIIGSRAMRLRDRISLFRKAAPDTVFFPAARFRESVAAVAARIPVRVGTGYRWYSPLYTKRIYDHRRHGDFHESVYNLRMLRPLGITPDFSVTPKLVLRDEDNSAAAHALKDVAQPFAVLHLLSGGSSPKWPLEQFEQLAMSLAQRLTLSVVLTGTAPEGEQLFSFAGRLGTRNVTSHVLMNLSLPTLAAVLAKASLVVANSTGPGHLAAAVGAPTIGLFPLATGLTAKRWGFRGPTVANLSPVTALAECPDCTPCTCMGRIQSDEVLRAAMEFL
jgi:heptosyltransferase III